MVAKGADHAPGAHIMAADPTTRYAPEDPRLIMPGPGQGRAQHRREQQVLRGFAHRPTQRQADAPSIAGTHFA